MRVLIAEDDADVVQALRLALGRSGHAVDAVTNGADAIWMATEVTYDAILLDVNLPPPDGFEVCRRLRDAEVWSAVIFVTGRDEVADRIAGLDAGGDDYLVKPFSLAELDARLRAVTRRGVMARPAVLRVGDIEIDPSARRVRRAGIEISLTPKEFVLLEMLARDEGNVVARSSIHETLWDFAFDAKSNVVEALVRRLRAKLDEPSGPSTIETVRGVGYRLKTD